MDIFALLHGSHSNEQRPDCLAQRRVQMADKVSERKAVVFSTVGCPYCKQAKDLLKAEGVAFDDIELSGDADLRLKVKEATGSHTVPQVLASVEQPPENFAACPLIDHVSHLSGQSHELH